MASPGESIATVRRYYLLKAHAAERATSQLAATWRAKQQALPGNAIPTTVPAQPALGAAGYLTIEDLGIRNRWGDGSAWGNDPGIWSAFEGASVDELVNQGLSRGEAEAVLSALGV